MELKSLKRAAIKSKKDDEICKWDPYNAVILTEFDGKLNLKLLKKVLLTRKNLMSKLDLQRKVIIETRDKKEESTIHVR